MPHATKRERRIEKSSVSPLLSVRAQDLGPYPTPSPQKCTVLSSIDGGHSRGGTAGGGSAPADPAAQEELFVDRSGTAAVWRSLGGQISHASFRSVVLGPGAHGLAGNNGQGTISQVVRCRFPTLLEGWSSKYDADTTRETRSKRERWTDRRQGEEKKKNKEKGRQRGRRRPRRGPWSVCILREPDLVTVHYPNGDSYDVALPCEARLLQPLGEGLLVQRFSGEVGEDLAQGIEGARAKGASDDSMDDDFPSFAGPGSEFSELSDADTPSLFSLLHPLDELRPVALLSPLKGALGIGSEEKRGISTSPQLAAEDQHQRLVCDAGERVIFAGGGGARGVGPDSSLVLTYHAGRRRHSLWLLLPVPEPREQQQPEPKAELEAEMMAGQPATTTADVSILGPLVNRTPGNSSWRGATGMSPTRDASSLSSTLLGVSALDSSSSVTALSMIDSAMAGVGGGRPPRDRLSVGNTSRVGGSTGRGRMSAGAGRRSSTGSNASWICPGNTRNEALANALGLGQSALGGGHVLILSRGGGDGGGIGARGGRDESMIAPLMGGFDVGGGLGVFGERDTLIEDEEDDDDEAQPIRPHLGLSLLWREAEDCSAAAQHAFCAAAGTPGEGGRGTATGAAAGPRSERDFLLCMVEEHSERLRALSISAKDKTVALLDGDASRLNNDSIVVTEAFTMPCRAAVGICATAGAEGEGFPGGAIAPDILVLTPDGRVILQRGETPVTGVTIPIPIPSTFTGRQNDEDQIDWLADAVGSCFTVETRAGERRRLRLSLDPASPLVAACLGAWDCVLTPTLAASLRADVMGVAQKLASEKSVGVGEGSSGQGMKEVGNKGVDRNRRSIYACTVGEDLDWIALVSVLRDLVLRDKPPVAEENLSVPAKSRDGEGRVNGCKFGSGGSQGIGSNSSSAWTAFLSSPSHNQYARDSVMLLSGLRVPDRQKNSCSESAKLTAAEPSKSMPSSPPCGQVLQTQKAAFRAESGAALDALHLVLEDMKISRLATSLVPRLASLLLSLARACGRKGECMRDFVDHYWRDATGCGVGSGEVSSMISVAGGNDEGRGWLPSRPTRFCKVPCIRGWVHARMRTARLVTRSAEPETIGGKPRAGLPTPRYSGEDEPFPTFPRNCAALQSTRRLCRFYNVLCGASGEAFQDAMAKTKVANSDSSAGGSGGQVRESRDWAGSRLVAAMLDEGYGVEDLDRAPLGLTLPLLEVLHAARGQAPADWPAAAQELVGREDLSALRRMLTAVNGGEEGDEDSEAKNDIYGAEEGYWAGGRISGSGAGSRNPASAGGHAGVVGQGVDTARGGGGGGTNRETGDLDGLAWVDEMSSLRFGRDRRVREACRLLRGSRPVRFHVERSPESSDHDHQQRQQARLLQLAMRTLAAPAGRGMLTLGTLTPLLAEPLPIPPLCLAGRIRKPADVIVNLDIAAAGVTADTTLWAEFHNGVAAGLRLRHEWGSAGSGGDGGGGRETGERFEAGGVSRTWITYNRPAGGANNAHGGLLMALGLQGHLSSLAMTDVYEYLTLGQESTTVGVLLGMAAARRGSADLSTHKMLCLHVPSLLPHPFAEMETSSVTQAAALAGVGLLYQGTSHRLMTEFLLAEMGKSPCSDRFSDREGYALACGLSLGMINLGKGASGGMAGVADLKLEQQLHRLLVGGKDPLASGGSGGNSDANSRSGVGARGSGRRPPSGGVIGSEISGPSRISPGEYVNTDVTAPAALAALALMHMRSGDRALAARLALPQTHFQLDYARPEQLLLRVVVRGLVMWEEVLPTDVWVDEQIPEVVSTEYARLHEPLPEELAAVVDRQTIRQAHANIVAGACLCLGLRFAGTADEQARATVLGRVMHFKRLRESSGGSAIGGGGGGGGARDPHLSSRRPERPVLEMCLCNAVAALGMIMAGTGDLECLRVMRELRGRVEGEVTYGTHMAISMGIGLLFLGGGMTSLGRQNEHIAALVAAFFPRYPASADDNQYHLQALRHMYVLATQRRGIDAVDVDTGEKLFVPLTVSLCPPDNSNTAAGSAVSEQNAADRNDDVRPDNDQSLRPVTPVKQQLAVGYDRDTKGDHVSGIVEDDNEVAGAGGAARRIGDRGSTGEKALSLVTPCVLPDLNDVSRISIRTPRYFPVELDLARVPAVAAALRRQCRIYVKRRVGHLSYKNDPHALRSLLFQSYPKPMASSSAAARSDSQHNHHSKAHDANHSGSVGGGGASDEPGQSKADFLSAFTEDPHLLNFARHFCDAGGGSGGSGGSPGATTGSSGGGVVGLPSGRRLMLGTGALGQAPALARYFGGALLECLAGEKAEALAPHLSLCHSVVTARHTVDAAAAWDLRLVLDYGRGSALQISLASEAVASTANIVGDSSGGGVGVVGTTGVGRRGRAGDMDERKDGGAGGVSARGRAGRKHGGGDRKGKCIRGEDHEAEEPPLPFALLHSDLLASLEVQLDAFFSSIDFDHMQQGMGGTKARVARGEAQREHARGGGLERSSRLWRYLSGGTMDFGDDVNREAPRLFGAFLSYFGIPGPSALELALGGRAVPADGLGLADAPALMRCLPGLSPSALLKMMAH